uniref:Putative secreted protein n=1 Tax=Ixodes ricinus TaxID=34613 RepID=A0A6B0V6L6_IXORI
MPVFLKLLTMMSAPIIPHASAIQLHSCSTDGLLILPAGVRSCWPSAIHSAYNLRTLSLNGLFKDTSKGCSTEVRPPGMTARSVRSSLNFARTGSTRWPRKLSRTRSDGKRSAPGRRPHTVLSQSTMRSALIQPFSCTRMCTPGGNFPLGRVFRLKMTYGGSFRPSAVTANITVHRCFSAPVVRTWTVRAPFCSKVVLLGMSKLRGVWSAFPICDNKKLFCCRILMTNRWKSTILSS